MKLGSHFTPEVIAKISLAHVGLHHSKETRAKMSASRKGRPFHGDKNRIGDFARGHHPSMETRVKMGIASRNRPPISEETRNKFRLLMMGEKNPNWKGGVIVTSGGYETIRTNPRFYVYVHRLNMEKTIGRKLEGYEEVHHINKNRKDNRIDNLALCSNVLAHRWCDTEEAKIFFG